jgi:hypothetical protein
MAVLVQIVLLILVLFPADRHKLTDMTETRIHLQNFALKHTLNICAN